MSDSSKSDPVSIAQDTFNRRVSAGVSRKLIETGLEDSDLAELFGVTTKQIGRKLRNESGYRVRDLVALAIRFGVDVLPQIESREDLFPEEIRPNLIWIDTNRGSEVFIRPDDASIENIGWNEVIAIAGDRFANDLDVPLRLASGSDLRRHVLVALRTLGIPDSRVFHGATETALEIGLGPQLVVGCFVSCLTTGSNDAVQTQLERLIETARLLVETAPTTILVAVLSAELADALAAFSDAEVLQEGQGFEVFENHRINVESIFKLADLSTVALGVGPTAMTYTR